MGKKSVWSGLLLAFSILSILLTPFALADIGDINLGGTFTINLSGINLSGFTSRITCVEGYVYANDNVLDAGGFYPNCTVTTSQISLIPQSSYFYFNNLKIASGVTLTFYSTAEGSSYYESEGGAGGEPSEGHSKGCINRRGVSGGNGGAMIEFGDAGTSTDGGAGGSTNFIVGSDVTFVVQRTADIRGTINVSGYSGYDGTSNTDNKMCGFPGSGGGGGTGGGIFTLYASKLTGTPTFISNGGKGGDAGESTDDEGQIYWCGYPGDPKTGSGDREKDCGGGSGGGGGGNAGQIIIHATDNTATLAASCNGGIGGAHGCGCDGSGDGKDGGSGTTRKGISSLERNESACLINTSLSSTEANPFTGNGAITPGYPYACSNSVDDDANQKTDFEDQSCRDECSEHTSGYIYDAVNTSYTDWFSSNTGNDGCCGDDAYNSTKITDYGFISSNVKKQYLCYDPYDPTDPVEEENFNGSYSWLNAKVDRYKIRTLMVNGRVADTVSNSEEWFYCNATGNSELKGNSIAEGKTFDNRFPDNKYSCADLMSSYFDGVIFEENCSNVAVSTDGYASNCCWAEEEIATADTVSNCNGICFFAHNNAAIIFSDASSTLGDYFGISTSDGVLEKDLCVADPELCLNTSFQFNTEASCSGQPNDYGNALCNTTVNFCSSGVLINTSAQEGDYSDSAEMQCCFGPNAKCIPKETMISLRNCTSFNGNVLNIASQNSYYCAGQIVPIANSTSACCIGSIYSSFSSLKSSPVSNASFLCYKENDEDRLSQCCYDSSCKNKDYEGHPDMSAFTSIFTLYGRVATKGSAIHTINNFDAYASNEKNSVIKDYAYRYTLNPYWTQGSDVPVLTTASFTTINLSGFTYLEFDILTDSENINILLNGQDLGELSKFYTNGDGTRVWHHAVVPLDYLTSSSLKKIAFNDHTGYRKVFIIDNIILSINESAKSNDSIHNTKNYYCSGGFEGWVDDLDAPVSATEFSEYGPFMFACSGIASFGWTGTQCCGDDTKGDNYGEFFNDTANGCFNGSRIIDDETVSKIKGVFESPYSVNDDLKDFSEKDILYFNYTFIGCQVPEGKYASLNVSYNGQAALDSNLIQKNIVSQCAVPEGSSHYCMNNAWRTLMPDGTNKGLAVGNQKILLKTAPSGPELIKNGFRN